LRQYKLFSYKFPKHIKEGILFDNSSIQIRLDYNLKRYTIKHPQNGEINISMFNIGDRYIAFEIKDLIISQEGNPSNTISIDYACIKLPCGF